MQTCCKFRQDELQNESAYCKMNISIFKVFSTILRQTLLQNLLSIFKCSKIVAEIFFLTLQKCFIFIPFNSVNEDSTQTAIFYSVTDTIHVQSVLSIILLLLQQSRFTV